MADSARRRKDVSGAAPERGTEGTPTSAKQGKGGEGREGSDVGGFGVIDVLRMMGGLFLLSCLLSYFVTNESILWGYRPWWTRPAVVERWIRGPIMLSDHELRAYDGSDSSKPIYLALNGTIYDVSSGVRVYGPGGSYHVFAGKDAARGFVTGCFAEDATPDLRGVEWTYVPTDVPDFDGKDGVKVSAGQKKYREQELRKAREQVRETIDGWGRMFSGEGGKDYFEVGKVNRDPAWIELLPKKPLCEAAQKARPQPQAAGKDAGAAYRPN